MRKATRRQFLGESAAFGSALAAPLFLPAAVLGREGEPGANGEVRIGFIGAGIRAGQLMEQLPKPGKIVAICDCDLRRANGAAKHREGVRVYQDYREMLDKEQLDAAVIATPDHARSLPTILAMQAGLDIYAEKPLTHCINEGRILVNWARKLGRVFQVGSQQRTMEINEYCCRQVREGKIGKLKKVQGVAYSGPRADVEYPEQPTPEGMDWNAWLGPAPVRPYHRDLQIKWSFYRDYSGGQVTNWGAHGIDQIQWALGKSLTGPTDVWLLEPGVSGKVGMRYADGVEVHYELAKAPMGGGIFIGSECKLEINRNRFATNPPDFFTDAPSAEVQQAWEGSGITAAPHLKNWLDCLESRGTPNADIEIGHRSVTVCHLMNIVRQVGRPLKWNPETEQFEGDDEANGLLDRPRRAGFEFPLA